MSDESESPEGQKMLDSMTQGFNSGIPESTVMWPFPRKPVGPGPKGGGKFKSSGGKPQSRPHSARPSRPQRGKQKKGMFAGWD
jgi:hypothetical protein